MEVYQSKYQSISFESENQLVTQTWTSLSSEIHDDLFKSEMLVLKETCMSRIPNYMIINTLDFDYIVGTEMQEWVFETINFPVIQHIPHLKTAFVMPDRLIPKLSLEQSLDGPKRLAALAYFANEKDARNWLFS